jgi:hypothetical protein
MTRTPSPTSTAATSMSTRSRNTAWIPVDWAPCC